MERKFLVLNASGLPMNMGCKFEGRVLTLIKDMSESGQLLFLQPDDICEGGTVAFDYTSVKEVK